MLIPESEQRDLLIYAFRYSLGRSTFAPYTVVEVLKGCWPQLSDHDKNLFQREIRAAIELGLAGHECDVKTWQKVLEL